MKKQKKNTRANYNWRRRVEKLFFLCEDFFVLFLHNIQLEWFRVAEIVIKRRRRKNVKHQKIRFKVEIKVKNE